MSQIQIIYIIVTIKTNYNKMSHITIIYITYMFPIVTTNHQYPQYYKSNISYISLNIIILDLTKISISQISSVNRKN